MEHTDEIALRSKNAEVLAQRNAEFLAKYDTDDKQIDYYTGLAMKLYEEFQIDGTYTDEGVRKNVAVWYENKSKQMQLLRKHPYWDEEAKAVVFLQTENREIDYYAAADILDNLEDYVGSRHRNIDYCEWMTSAIRRALMGTPSEEEQTGVLTEALINRINGELGRGFEIPSAIARMLRCGTKITRLVRKCFENIKLCDGETWNATTLVDEGEDARTRKSFDKYYAKFADCLSELQIERITLVSLNFLDFMTMSNGNSWSSCHFINSHGIFHEDAESSYSGAYKQGCLSYALDEPSMILYTLPATFDGTDYYRCQKLTRMCCQYENGILITGKCYPNNQDPLITRYRQIAQLIMSQVNELPNLWTFSRKTNKINGFVETAENSAHYTDYLYDGQKPTISWNKSIEIDLDAAMTIGHEAYCLHCGNTLYGGHNKWLQCDKHRKSRICVHCGRVIARTEECHQIFDDYYCTDCVFYCEVHDRYEPMHRKYGTVRMQDGEKTVCNEALYGFTQCKDCGVWFNDDEMTDGHCKECIKQYVSCACCGSYIKTTDVHEYKGKSFCKMCAMFSESKLQIRKKDIYDIGDYVLMADNFGTCRYYVNGHMKRNYPNRIVEITDKSGNEYSISNLDGHDWSWSDDCFVGCIENCKEEYVGTTMQNIIELIKEAADEN